MIHPTGGSGASAGQADGVARSAAVIARRETRRWRGQPAHGSVGALGCWARALGRALALAGSVRHAAARADAPRCGRQAAAPRAQTDSARQRQSGRHDLSRPAPAGSAARSVCATNGASRWAGCGSPTPTSWPPAAPSRADGPTTARSSSASASTPTSSSAGAAPRSASSSCSSTAATPTARPAASPATTASSACRPSTAPNSSRPGTRRR